MTDPTPSRFIQAVDAAGKAAGVLSLVTGLIDLFKPDPFEEVSDRFDQLTDDLDGLRTDIGDLKTQLTNLGQEIIDAIDRITARDFAMAVRSVDTANSLLELFLDDEQPGDTVNPIDVIFEAETALSNVLSQFADLPDKLTVQTATPMIEALNYAVSVRLSVALYVQDGAVGRTSIRNQLEDAAETLMKVSDAMEASLVDEVETRNPFLLGTFSQRNWAADTVFDAVVDAGGDQYFDNGLFPSRFSFALNDARPGGINATELLNAVAQIDRLSDREQNLFYVDVLDELGVSRELARYDFHKFDMMVQSLLTADTVSLPDIVIRNGIVVPGTALSIESYLPFQSVREHPDYKIAAAEATELMVAADTATLRDTLALQEIADGYLALTDGEFERGTNGDNSLTGSEGNDVLLGRGGADMLNGRGDADVLRGGSGNDTVEGGAGADFLEGDDGRDVLRGQGGDDRLIGGSDTDKLIGGNGRDQISGGSGADTLKGGGGADGLSGDAGADALFGGGGADQLFGRAGADLLQGEKGADTIEGGNGGDTLIGGQGADWLQGDKGNDLLEGGNGDDILIGNEGADLIIGGAGDEEIGGGKGPDTLRGGTGDDSILGGPGADVFIFEEDFGYDQLFDFEVGIDVIVFEGYDLDDVSYRIGEIATVLTVDGNTAVVLGAAPLEDLI